MDYGTDLREFLLKQCQVKMVLDSTQRSFASADVNTVIALFSSPLEKENAERNARFVMFRIAFQYALSPILFEEIEDAGGSVVTPEYRVFTKRQSDLLLDKPDLQIEENDHFGGADYGSRVLTPAEYEGSKWGGKYLRAPDIYWTMFKKMSGKMLALGELVDYKYGIKPGAVKFFYLTLEKAEEWEIEEEFLRPIITSSQDQQSFTIKADKLLFYCSENIKDLRGTGARRYIEWGEREGFHRGSAVRSHRPYWYSLHGEPVDFLLLQFWDKRFFTPTAEDYVLCSNNFFYGKSREFDFNSAAALLNSTVHFLQLEIMGRSNQGQGVLNTYGPDFAWIKCLNPHHVDEESLRDAFGILSARSVKSIFDEVESEDRRALDNIVFDALKLTHSERDAVYEAVIDLVETRLRKARSLS